MDPSSDLPPIHDPAVYIPQPPPSVNPNYFSQPQSVFPGVYIPQPPYNVQPIYAAQPPTTFPASQVFPPQNIEPAAQIANAGYPSTNHASNSAIPAYAEMIINAIATLKEKDGSSRQAISKYLENQYPNLLPPTHANLLTQSLKRLKNNGQLVMIKHSYALPTSAPVPISLPSPQTNGESLSPSVPKRGPGRPPKIKPDLQAEETAQPVSVEPVTVDSVASEPVAIEPENMLVSLGLIDEGPKRGRGRPPKSLNKQPLAPAAVSDSSVLGKRGRGRPPRPKSLLDVKRRPQRSTSLPNAGGLENGLKRGRGRPKRNALAIVNPSGRPGRPRGRPPKNAALHGGANGVLPAKRPGRPPKSGVAKKPRRLSGRPLGRPRKDSTPAIQASSSQQEKAYQDLKSKLEHIQSKIRYTVGVVKPYFNTEVTVSAVGGALRELEELALMDLTAAPVTVVAETEEEVPPPPPPPQPESQSEQN